MKRLLDAGIIILIVIFAIAVGGKMSHKFSKKKHHTNKKEFIGHDDKVEEFFEDVHHVISGGEKQDFTPKSPEK